MLSIDHQHDLYIIYQFNVEQQVKHKNLILFITINIKYLQIIYIHLKNSNHKSLLAVRFYKIVKA